MTVVDSSYCELLVVRGRVQGVGFRPFIMRLANQCGVRGWVRNCSDGVEIHLEGSRKQCEEFVLKLRSDGLPPLLRIDSISHKAAVYSDASGFIIAESTGEGKTEVVVSPDIAMCKSCRFEMENSLDRRFTHSFINCTDCGPRFTVIRGIPYDREQTTMAPLALCERCAEEMANILDRRFHTQTNACPQCGPYLVFRAKNGSFPSSHPVEAAVRLLQDGGVLVVKGIGGYHLLCDAACEKAVRRLREIKGRDGKPFAVMSPNLEKARQFAVINDREGELLQSAAAPIVVVRSNQSNLLASSVTNLTSIGVMLPYNPLYAQVCRPFDALVVTSLNRQGEPTMIEDTEAVQFASDTADGLLYHNRSIHQRCDDSVLADCSHGLLFFRRARGFVPEPLLLPEQYPEIMAVGSQQKNAYCFIRGDKGYVGPYVGEMAGPVGLLAWVQSLERFKRLFGFAPVAVALDLHPGYIVSRWAREHAGLPVIEVQHHHAHLASCLAENRYTEPAIGVVFDGQGLGTDGTLWGGEILIGSMRDYWRFAHLRHMPLLSGERAVRQPWRVALGALLDTFGDAAQRLPLSVVEEAKRADMSLLSMAAGNRRISPLTSSAGRLFDAASALLGYTLYNRYEGEAAVLLEDGALPNISDGYPFTFEQRAGIPVVIDWRNTVRYLVQDIIDGQHPAYVAGKFHQTVAEMIIAICRLAREKTKLETVALAGGVFQNRVLNDKLHFLLRKEGFQVLSHTSLPPNDSSLALGQAVVAGAKHRGGM